MGGEILEIRPGGAAYIEPGEEHWHGATPDRFMAHVAMQEADEYGQENAAFLIGSSSHFRDDPESRPDRRPRIAQ